MRAIRRYGDTPLHARNATQYEYLHSLTMAVNGYAMSASANQADSTAKVAEPNKTSPEHTANVAD